MTCIVSRTRRVAAAAMLLALAPAAVRAQDARAEIASGDRAYAGREWLAALAHYERAASLDTLSHEAAWKASRSAADLEAGARQEPTRRRALLASAEAHARRAVALGSGDAEAHFSLARALGLAARSVGVRERVRYANDVRAHALECLRREPRHAGCLHILGAWNAEVMRLSGVERFLARRILGGRTFGAASWDEAVRYLEAAVAAEPWRIAHRLELAAVYRDTGRTADMRREYETIGTLESRDYADPLYKEEARAALRR